MFPSFTFFLTLSCNRRHNDRLNAADAEKGTEDDITPNEDLTDKDAEEDKIAEDNNTAEQEQSTGEETQELTASATSLAVSIFSTFVFALLI